MKTAILVARSDRAALAHDRGETARLGQLVEVFVLVRVEGRWYGEVPRARVDGRTVSVRPLSELGPGRVSWRVVEPAMMHEPEREGERPRPYTNAVLLGASHGRWRGYDAITYFERPLARATGARLEVTDSRPSDPELDVRGGLGTLRYAATVVTPRGTFATPGAADVGTTGIDPRVLRVSFRGGDDFPGWLSAYFNVPQLFGSAGGPANHQTDRFVGADCADVLVGALRSAGRRDVAYTSVGGLGRYARHVSDVLIQSEEGRLATESGGPVDLRFGRDVRRGDVVIIDYVDFADLPRAWDHVGVLGDDDGDGRLDADDPLFHMSLSHGLTVEPLRAQGAVRLRVLRLKRPLG